MHLIIFLVLICIICGKMMSESATAKGNQYKWNKHNEEYNTWDAQVTDRQLEDDVEDEIKEFGHTPEFRKKIDLLCPAQFPPLTDHSEKRNSYLKRILMAQHGKIPTFDTLGVQVVPYTGCKLHREERDWRIGCANFMRWWSDTLHEHGVNGDLYYIPKYGEVREFPITLDEFVEYRVGLGEFRFSPSIAPVDWEERQRWLMRRTQT